ncbi:MAG: hypothetical protein B6D54_02010 [Epsilonproteobacteria bacterium 4484_65]|nr:MAG: hypothetical protein B6D54_02010 [Epsilonproteobacteria bacterium 4484_65]
MKQITTCIVSILLIAVFSFPASAMPPNQMKQILNMTQNNWVSFRDFNGKQLIYFTHLESYTCGIKEVRYSINSDDLGKVWELQPCDIRNPMTITKDIIYLTMPLDTAKSIAVQVTFADGTKSEILRKNP